MIKVGDWVKASQISAEYIKIVELNESDSKAIGLLYGYFNRYAKRIEIDTRYVEKISPEDVLEKVFDEVLELREDIRELKDAFSDIKSNL